MLSRRMVCSESPSAVSARRGVDTAPYGLQFGPITGFEGEISGNHQLSVTLGLVQMVKRAVDGRALGMQQGGSLSGADSRTKAR